MNNLKISVVIPIYNVEKYISECLNSITNQTYKNLEILCIDDCGDDNSIEVVERLAKVDNRIKVLSYGKNMGISYARNYGLKNSTGNYIYFIDSDDFIQKTYIEEMIKHIDKYDVIQNDNIVYYPNNTRNSKITNRSGVFEINLKNQNPITASVWNKLYKKEFLINNNILFPENIKIGEDLYFNYHCMILLNKIKIIDTSKYYYRQRINSTSKVLKKDNDILKTFELLYELSIKSSSLNKFSLPLFHLRRHLKSSKNKKIFYENLKSFFERMKQSVFQNKKIYSKKDIVFFNCVLNNNSYFIFNINFFLINYFNQYGTAL